MRHAASDFEFARKKARTFVKKHGRRLRQQTLRRQLQWLSKWRPQVAARQAEELFMTPHPLPLRPQQEKVLLRASQGTVQVGEDTVRVWRWGSGPGVLLVHGWSGRGGQFADWVDPLVEAGFQVTLFDAPGHGASDGRFSSVVHFLRAIGEVSRQFGPFETLVGHSMGGAAALVAVAHGLPVDRLITLAAPAYLEQVLTRAFQGQMGLDPAVNPLILARLETRLGEAIPALDPARLMRQIQQPWLLLHDLDDREIPWGEAEWMAQRAPAAQLLSSKGLGHYRMLRDAGLRRAALAFMRGENPQPLVSPGLDALLREMRA